MGSHPIDRNAFNPLSEQPTTENWRALRLWKIGVAACEWCTILFFIALMSIGIALGQGEVYEDLSIYYQG
jgi:hypothetical protein